MQWTTEEVQLLHIFLEQNYTREEIAESLDRTKESVVQKMKRLGLLAKRVAKKPYIKKGYRVKTTYKQELPFDIEVLEEYINARTKLLHRHTCGYEWYVTPHNILCGSRCPKCANHGIKCRTHSEYIASVPIDIEVLDTYINSKTKLRHKHTCGHIWSTVPNSIIHQKTGCPKCANHGINLEVPAYTYLLHFPELNIFKIGITNNLDNRIQQFGIKPEIVFFRYFEDANTALSLEKEWLENIKHLKYNTSILTSGNTETFKF